MTFDQFVTYVECNILRGWKEDASVNIQKMKKNNGIVLTGLYISEKDSVAIPAIYLESYFDKLCEGQAMDSLLADIREEYRQGMFMVSGYDMDTTNYDWIRDRLIYRLVNYDRNRELLKEYPHIRLEDLAVTCHFIAHEDDIGISTALVGNRELSMWGVTFAEILLEAQRNTERIFPQEVILMEDYIKRFVDTSLSCEPLVPIYIVTNEQKINGATVLLYEHFLEDFCLHHPDNYYILPSSIHEVLLVPEMEIDDPAGLTDLVRHANATVVSDEDFLSDSVYYYDRRKKSLSIFKK